MIAREAEAWSERDPDLLLSIFHPDMVWTWPHPSESTDPAEWTVEVSRFNENEWREGWARIFACEIIRNRRSIRRIAVSEEEDSAWAVVDVDTLWRDAEGRESGWKGRALKSYVKVNGTWKMVANTGI